MDRLGHRATKLALHGVPTWCYMVSGAGWFVEVIRSWVTCLFVCLVGWFGLVWFGFFETGFLCIALAVLELTL